MSRRRPPAAMIVAALALFVALGGGAYAALKLPANSVGSKQLRRNAVSSAKVKNGSLKAADFAAGQLPAGPKGAVGPQGPKGYAGAPATTLWAFVDAPAALVSGHGAVRVDPGVANNGNVDVVFDRDVSNCAIIATLRDTTTDAWPGGQIATQAFSPPVG